MRHPRPAVPPGICYGASDPDLAEDALECAARLREKVPAHLPLFSSPLRRCRRLAEALHENPQWDARLREMDFGAWELQPWDLIPRSEIDAWAAAPMTYAPPGGEAPAALQARVLAFLTERRAAGDGDFAAVTHAGVMRVMAAHLLGLSVQSSLAMQFEYGELMVLP